MINGIYYLKDMYSNFDEKCFQPDGIDLRLGTVYEMQYDEDKMYGISEDAKVLPNHIPIEPDVYPLGIGWILEPHKSYILQVDRPIHIQKGSAQFYLPRSSLLRMGVNVATALGDTDFNGILSFLGINESEHEIFLGKGVRFAQLIDMRVDGSGSYNGDYNIDMDRIEKDIQKEFDDMRIQF